MSKKRQSQLHKMRQCKRCSIEFIPKNRQVYCSPECHKPRIELHSLKCPNCTHQFMPKRKDARYCSSRCRSRAGLERQKAKLAKQGLSKPSKPLETRLCVCGRSFDQKRHWQQYCSGRCGDRQRQKLRIERNARELIERGFYSSSDGG
jgi:hypothetical protein